MDVEVVVFELAHIVDFAHSLTMRFSLIERFH